jgi:hypothetical protein
VGLDDLIDRAIQKDFSLMQHNDSRADLTNEIEIVFDEAARKVRRP